MIEQTVTRPAVQPALKERPILFSGAMVRAILEGRKTVTRRPVKRLALKWLEDGFEPGFVADPDNAMCPYGQPGDRLWVREAWQLHEKFTDNCVVVYKANERNSWTEFHRRFPVEVSRGTQAKPFQTNGFRPSIHMPRWACRILLEITAVRIERLQDISEEQAEAEGVERPENITNVDVWDGTERELFNAMNQPRDRFKRLWDDINGPDSWGANPWVWVVEFRRVMP